MMSKRIEMEHWSIEDLIPYEKNAKRHSPEQISRLAGLIAKAGWTQPIVVDGDNNRGSIIAGHGRRLAAIHLGLKTKIPVRVLYGYSLAEIDALRLADNNVTSIDYDVSLIQEEVLRLDGEGVSMREWSFSDTEMDKLLGNLGEFDDSMFVDDITDAVEGQAERNREAVSETDDAAAPITDALGFKRVTVAQSRVIRNFMMRIESQTGKRGAAALVETIENGVKFE
jgi:ParB-like chromosome segregation protein Spo0J